MTRKDYRRIAAALSEARAYCETDNQRRGVERATLTIAAALADDSGFDLNGNRRFDRERFIAAAKETR